MNSQIIKTIIVGALLGAAIFAAPYFVLKAFVFLLVIGLLIRLFRGRRYYRRGPWGFHGGMAFAEKVRSMSDDEFEEFKSNCGGYDRGRKKGED